MAKTKNNCLTKGLSGKVGNQFFPVKWGIRLPTAKSKRQFLYGIIITSHTILASLRHLILLINFYDFTTTLC